MITFSELGSYGRLGNQLFQYAALKSTALKNGYVCKVPDFSLKNWHGQSCLLSYFNIEAETLNKTDLQTINNIVSENPNYYGVYTDILENIPDNTNLFGFFQNTKYFKNFEDQIKKELSPRKELLNREERRMNLLKNSNEKFVSLHIRTGDNNDGTNPVYVSHYGSGPLDTNCTVGKYVTKALEYFPTDGNTKFLVFVGGSRTGNDREDILWAKNYFSDKKFIVNDTNDPLIDFIRISLCEHNIVSFASSFSWWAAYINKNPNKIVICPEDYGFDGKTKHKEHFYPDTWKQI